MKRTRLAVAVLAAGSAVGLTGCGSGKQSPSDLASNESMSVQAQPARQRGLMFASDGLGAAVFADETPSYASVPDRD